jgi:hypothetical protein
MQTQIPFLTRKTILSHAVKIQFPQTFWHRAMCIMYLYACAYLTECVYAAVMQLLWKSSRFVFSKSLIRLRALILFSCLLILFSQGGAFAKGDEDFDRNSAIPWLNLFRWERRQLRKVNHWVKHTPWILSWEGLSGFIYGAKQLLWLLIWVFFTRN